jgi:hypothetical protein
MINIGSCSAWLMPSAASRLFRSQNDGWCAPVAIEPVCFQQLTCCAPSSLRYPQMEETTEAKAAWDSANEQQRFALQVAQKEVGRLRAAAVGDAVEAASHKAQLDTLLLSSARQKAQVRAPWSRPPCCCACCCPLRACWADASVALARSRDGSPVQTGASQPQSAPQPLLPKPLPGVSLPHSWTRSLPSLPRSRLASTRPQLTRLPTRPCSTKWPLPTSSSRHRWASAAAACASWPGPRLPGRAACWVRPPYQHLADNCARPPLSPPRPQPSWTRPPRTPLSSRPAMTS